MTIIFAKNKISQSLKDFNKINRSADLPNSLFHLFLNNLYNLSKNKHRERCSQGCSLIKVIHKLKFIHNNNKISKSLRNKTTYTCQQVNIIHTQYVKKLIVDIKTLVNTVVHFSHRLFTAYYSHKHMTLITTYMVVGFTTTYAISAYHH